MSGSGIENFKYKEITSKVIGSAMHVHSELGAGFQEVVYQRALSIELNKRSVRHEKEIEIPIFYSGYKIGSRRVDFKVEGYYLWKSKL